MRSKALTDTRSCLALTDSQSCTLAPDQAENRRDSRQRKVHKQAAQAAAEEAAAAAAALEQQAREEQRERERQEQKEKEDRERCEQEELEKRERDDRERREREEKERKEREEKERKAKDRKEKERKAKERREKERKAKWVDELRKIKEESEKKRQQLLVVPGEAAAGASSVGPWRSGGPDKHKAQARTLAPFVHCPPGQSSQAPCLRIFENGIENLVLSVHSPCMHACPYACAFARPPVRVCAHAHVHTCWAHNKVQAILCAVVRSGKP